MWWAPFKIFNILLQFMFLLHTCSSDLSCFIHFYLFNVFILISSAVCIMFDIGKTILLWCSFHLSRFQPWKILNKNKTLVFSVTTDIMQRVRETTPSKKRGEKISTRVPIFIFPSSLWSQKCRRTTSAHLASCSHHEDLSRFALCQFPMIECNWDQITPPHSLSLSPQESLITSDLAPAQLWHTGNHFLGGLWLLTDRQQNILSTDVWASKSNTLQGILQLYSLGLSEFVQHAISLS